MSNVNNKPMTKAARLRHLRSSGCGGCPYCGEDYETLDFGELDLVEDGDIQQTVRCLVCGRRWMDVFRLVEVRELY